MAKTHRKNKPVEPMAGDVSGPGRAKTDTCTAHADDKADLHFLRVELVKLQRHFVRCENSILALLEGRDASGKDGCTKHIVKNLSPRDTRVVALGMPSDRERRA